MAATVSVEPAGPSCWDEPLRIAVRGLAPEQPVTLRASLRDEKGALFRAHARYCADAGGELDLARAPALGGSFAGLEPMGLLWALQPDRPFWRLTKRDVRTPLAVELEVLDGHGPEPGQLLARALLERRFLPPGVRRQPVRAGRVRASLFLPPGESLTAQFFMTRLPNPRATECGIPSSCSPRGFEWNFSSEVHGTEGPALPQLCAGEPSTLSGAAACWPWLCFESSCRQCLWPVCKGG